MEKKLTNKDLWKIFWNQMTIRTCNNYERQQNAGFTQAMMPAIEKLYDTEEKKQEAYERHMEYFLTNDITSAIPVGISAAMEEENANNDDFDGSIVTDIKTALMGPLAGLGDSLLGWFGPLFFVLGMCVVSLGTRYVGVFQGYSQGIKLLDTIQNSGLIDKITDLASLAAFMIVGGFIPALVVITTPISIGSGESVLVLQDTLDSLMPGFLGLMYTLLMYILITKKKISATILIFSTMIIGVAGTYLGILG